MKKNDYYIRMPDCAECRSSRGNRCRDAEGREISSPHAVRIIESGVHSPEVIARTSVVCPTCGADVGSACRSGPYRTRMTKLHASRRRAIEEADTKEGSL